MASIKEMERLAAWLRADVIRWSKEYPDVAAERHHFDLTFKEFRGHLSLTSEDGVSLDRKRAKMERALMELQNWHEGLYQIVVAAKRAALDAHVATLVSAQPEPVVVEAEPVVEEEQPVKRRGGRRPGAGRPSLGGAKRVVTITLSPESWELIDAEIAAGKASSLADYFRTLWLCRNWMDAVD